MDEKIVEIGPEVSGTQCALCGDALEDGARAVFCPRCKTPHHLDCWIRHGGCAKKGCRQLASSELLPPKKEEPVRASKIPAWVYGLVAALAVAIGVGLWFNARHAAAERMKTISVMLPASIDQAYWQGLMDEYNMRLAERGKSILLTFVPEIVPVMQGQTIEAGYYEQKLLIQMAAKDAPELVLLAGKRMPQYVSQGALAPVDDVAGKLSALVDPARLSLATHEGRVYGIPHPAEDAFFAIPSTARHIEEAKELLAFVIDKLASRVPAAAGTQDGAGSLS